MPYMGKIINELIDAFSSESRVVPRLSMTLDQFLAAYGEDVSIMSRSERVELDTVKKRCKFLEDALDALRDEMFERHQDIADYVTEVFNIADKNGTLAVPSAFEFEKRMAETTIVICGSPVKLRYDTLTNTFELLNEVTKLFEPISDIRFYD